MGAKAEPPPVSTVPHSVLLSTWLSPGFPVGAFSYSHGLETAIASGEVTTADQLADWIAFLVERGSGWCDALLLAQAWRAAVADDMVRLLDAAELARAMAVSGERQLETTALGDAFLKAAAAGWPSATTERLAGTAGVAYPVAVGATAAAHGVPLAATLAAYLNAFAANLVSVAVRLVPLGQSAGLAVLARLQPLGAAIALLAEAAPLDALGNAAIRSDIAAMRHEVLYSRVFRS
ncbi:MAG: urease accessory protein UreF [Bauldia sp.]|nr:urease accessory protein UreF [Bauldia sp.]